MAVVGWPDGGRWWTVAGRLRRGRERESEREREREREREEKIAKNVEREEKR